MCRVTGKPKLVCKFIHCDDDVGSPNPSGVVCGGDATYQGEPTSSSQWINLHTTLGLPVTLHISLGFTCNTTHKLAPSQTI